MNWRKKLDFFQVFFCLLLGAVILLQMFLSLNNYARAFRRPLWRMRELPSFERSAYFYMATRGAQYLKFIDSIIPPNGTVVTVPAGRGGAFSSQNILQFFMLRRTIFGCNSSDQMMLSCLQDPNTYILAINDFPDKEAVAGKKYIPYPSGDGFYQGIYVPSSYTSAQAPPAQQTSYNPLLTLLVDLCWLAALFILGFTLIRIILRGHSFQEALILGLPAGLGLFSWIFFILSWAGVPLNLATTLSTWLILFVLLVAVRWRQVGSEKFLRPVLPRLTLPKINWVQAVVILGIMGMFALAMVISVGRGYSLFDDMAIWSLKGYVIADHHSIWGAADASGHGLAYPLNISLNITAFTFISGDMLPGSKLLFPLLAAAMLLGCYRFWRRYGVPALLAALGIFALISIPVIFQHATTGFANLPFTAYLVLGTLWSIEGLLEDQISALMAGGVLLGLAGWTRPEGIGFALAIAVALMIFRGLRRLKARAILPWLLMIVIIPGIWLIFSYSQISTNQIGNALRASSNAWISGSFQLEALKQEIQFTLEQVRKLGTWGLIFPAMIVLLLISIFRSYRQINPAAMLLLPAALVALLAPYILFFVESFNESNFIRFLTVSFDRAFFPAAIFFALLAILFAGYHQRQSGF